MRIGQLIKVRLRSRLSSLLDLDEQAWPYLPRLSQAVLEVNNVIELKKRFKWPSDPTLDIERLNEFEYDEDLNERRLRDAEALGSVARNTFPGICVDIGTSLGHSAALMALNAPDSTIYTINILPEEIATGAGGVYTTVAFSIDQIGSYYRRRGLTNIRQVYGNTATWEPDIGVIDLAFIDGSHDTEFVYSDTLKMLRRMRTGSYIVWHDFNLELAPKYAWIHSVCLGVERLFRDGYLHGRIFHLRDSWTGIYRIP